MYTQTIHTQREGRGTSFLSLALERRSQCESSSSYSQTTENSVCIRDSFHQDSHRRRSCLPGIRLPDYFHSCRSGNHHQDNYLPGIHHGSSFLPGIHRADRRYCRGMSLSYSCLPGNRDRSHHWGNPSSVVRCSYRSDKNGRTERGC